jgi:hypothetical protein
MSSFLHDFDLSRASNLHTLDDKGDDDSHFCLTPNDRSMTSIAQRDKRVSTQKFNNKGKPVYN